jgi:cytochrome P450
MNLFAPEMRRNPYPAYDRLRSASPLLHVPQMNFWMIFDYEGVKRAFSDHEAFSSSMYKAGRGNPEWFIFFDPPRQTKLRALVMKAFTPRMIAELEPRIREISRILLDQAVRRGGMDLAAEYAVPLPMMVIAEMLGVPAGDYPLFKCWSDIILNLSYAVPGGTAHSSAAADYFAIRAEMDGYLSARLDERRSAPREDLLTQLVEAEVDGERLSDAEILGFFQLLLVAGTETTTNLITNAVLALIENPDQLALLRGNPGLVPSAIEEVLRYRSPVQFLFRATARDVEMHGQTIPAGVLVLPVVGSANHDPRQFTAPERFDVARDPNPHIAFGHGVHFCIGAPLSRLEARIALPDLLTRLPRLERSSNEPWEPRKALHVHGPSSLGLRW